MSAILPEAWQTRQVSVFLAVRPERSVVLVPGTPGVAPVIADTCMSRMPPFCWMWVMAVWLSWQPKQVDASGELTSGSPR